MERKLLLLGILHRHEMHGYQLFEYIDQGLSACTDLTKPTAYYLLNKMAEDGWITEEQVQEGNRPPRKVYHLTPEGEFEFQRLLGQNLAHFSAPNFPGDIGLALLDNLEVEEALNLLQQRRAALLLALEALEATPEHPGSFQWAIRHQIYYLRNEAVWLDQVINELSTSLKTKISGMEESLP